MHGYAHHSVVARRTPPIARRRTSALKPWAVRIVLVATMVLGSLALWVASPVAWLWIASRVASSAHPGMGPYALLFGGVIATAVLLGRILLALDEAYRAVAHTPRPRLHEAWLRASGQQKLERPDSGPLGVVMALSVIAALAALVAWIAISGKPVALVTLL